jgi:hypothetical protein
MLFGVLILHLVCNRIVGREGMFRSAGFSWLAWSWYGNSSENAALDLTASVGDAKLLTERGEDIVSGKGGGSIMLRPQLNWCDYS